MATTLDRDCNGLQTFDIEMEADTAIVRWYT